jgi:hypothetical protein
MPHKTNESKRPRSASFDLLYIVGALAVGFLAIEGYHRWKKPRPAEANPLKAAHDELAEIHRQRTIAVSKLKHLQKHETAAPKPEVRRVGHAEHFATAIVDCEERFANQRGSLVDAGCCSAQVKMNW